MLLQLLPWLRLLTKVLPLVEVFSLVEEQAPILHQQYYMTEASAESKWRWQTATESKDSSSVARAAS